MRWLKNTAVIFFIAVLQLTLLKYFEIGGIVPGVLLVFGFILIFTSDFESAWPYLAGIGIVLDLFSVNYFGTGLAALIITGFLSSALFKAFFNQKSVLPGIMVGFFAFIFYYAVLFFFNGIISGFGTVSASGFLLTVKPIFTAVIYNFFIFAVLYAGIRPLNLFRKTD